MTTLQKTLATTTFVLLTGVVIHQLHQTTLLRNRLEVVESANEEQSQQFKSERDDLLAQMAALRRQSADEQSNLSEVIKLRGELASLRAAQRQEKAEALPGPSSGKPEVENQDIPGNSWTNEKAKALLAKAPEIPMVPAGQWTNVGFASPTAALETLNWSIANHDTNTYNNSLIWDVQAKVRADAVFASAPESVRQAYGNADTFLLDWWLNNSAPGSATRVISQTADGPNDATLVQQTVYSDGNVQENTLQFERDTNGQWRQVISPRGVPEPWVLLNSLATHSPSNGN